MSVSVLIIGVETVVGLLEEEDDEDEEEEEDDDEDEEEDEDEGRGEISKVERWGELWKERSSS